MFPYGSRFLTDASAGVVQGPFVREMSRTVNSYINQMKRNPFVGGGQMGMGTIPQSQCGGARSVSELMDFPPVTARGRRPRRRGKVSRGKKRRKPAKRNKQTGGARRKQKGGGKRKRKRRSTNSKRSTRKRKKTGKKKRKRASTTRKRKARKQKRSKSVKRRKRAPTSEPSGDFIF